MNEPLTDEEDWLKDTIPQSESNSEWERLNAMEFENLKELERLQSDATDHCQDVFNDPPRISFEAATSLFNQKKQSNEIVIINSSSQFILPSSPTPNNEMTTNSLLYDSLSMNNTSNSFLYNSLSKTETSFSSIHDSFSNDTPMSMDDTIESELNEPLASMLCSEFNPNDLIQNETFIDSGDELIENTNQYLISDLDHNYSPIINPLLNDDEQFNNSQSISSPLYNQDRFNKNQSNNSPLNNQEQFNMTQSISNKTRLNQSLFNTIQSNDEPLFDDDAFDFKEMESESITPSKTPEFKKQNEIDLKRHADIDFIISLKKIKTKETHIESMNKGETTEESRVNFSTSYSFRPISGLYHTATKTNGTRLYFPEITKKSFITRGVSGRLLGFDVHNMVKGIQHEIKEKEMQKNLEHNLVQHDVNQSNHYGDELWVHKYAPKCYTDLIGDEKLNRQVLSWVKQWDFCVFKASKSLSDVFVPFAFKPFKKGFNHKENNSNTTNNSTNPTNQWNQSNPSTSSGDSKFVKKFNDKSKTIIDPFRRPEKRILLLTGRSGRGKTTLAHIVAKHSHYNVIEINASDDRTGESLRNKLYGAIESKSVINSKPNLVIIDEIDGASTSGQGEMNFIKVLLQLLETCNESKEQIETIPSYGIKKIKKNVKKRKQLMFPIICICNDQYAPVLRTLRPFVQIFQFIAPSYRQLSNRLLEICRNEKCKIDLRTLMYLCEMTQGDIRSCLNTLQFIHKSLLPNDFVTIEMINRMNIGHKDMQDTIISQLDKLFILPLSKVKQSGHDKFIDRILPFLDGDSNKLMQGMFIIYYVSGCFETYLTSKFVDYKGKQGKGKLQDILEWIQFYDSIQLQIQTKNQHELTSYLSYSLINFHRLFATAKRIPFEYPKHDYQSFLLQSSHSNILTSLWISMSLTCQRTWSSSNLFLVECVSFLVRIIDFDFKTNNIQLLKSFERKKMESTSGNHY